MATDTQDLVDEYETMSPVGSDLEGISDGDTDDEDEEMCPTGLDMETDGGFDFDDDDESDGESDNDES